MKTFKLIIAFVVLIGVVPMVANGASDKDGDFRNESAQILNFKDFQDRIMYPESLMQRHIEGQVRIKMRVDEYGNVTDYWILESSSPLLAKSCISQIKYLEIFPAIDENGHARPSYVVLPFTFKLNRN